MVLGARSPTGVKLAVLLATSYTTVPATAVSPGPVSKKLVVPMVAGSIASLKAAVMVWLIATPVSASAGRMALTVGEVVSGVGPVVKLQIMSVLSALPARSLAPVLILAV